VLKLLSEREHAKLQLSIIQSQADMLIRYVNYCHYASVALWRTKICHT